MTDALFKDLGGGQYLPTAYARGPWSPDALHGGPVALLSARAAEDALNSTGRDAHLPVRLTLNLERPVTLTPLTVSAIITRPGHKVQVVEVSVSNESGQRLARAEVQAIRRTPITLPDDVLQPNDPQPEAPPVAPSSFDGWGFPTSDVAYHQNATEHRLVQGALGQPGPVIDWIKLTVPVVSGETPSPFQRVAAAADFLNGVSWVLSGGDWIFINPDLTVTLHRLPVGDQVAVASTTRIASDGVGTAEADLYDTQGRIGRAVQTLLIEPR